MSAVVLDRNHLSLYTGGDSALEAELFGLLSSQIEACLGRLRNAKEAQAWKDAAHTLKGAARAVGAMALGQACEEAEGRPMDDAAFKAIEAEAERAKAAMAAA